MSEGGGKHDREAPRDREKLRALLHVNEPPASVRSLLHRFEDVLGAQGAPIIDAWQPGLQPEESSALVSQQTGLRLPVEGETWFAWHNGVPESAARSGHPQTWWLMGSDFSFLELRDCCDSYGVQREHAKWCAENAFFDSNDPQDFWPNSWFPLLCAWNGDLLAIDCSVERGEPSPVFVWHPEDITPPTRAASSLASAVGLWLELFEQRLWYFASDENRWKKEYSDIPVEVRLTGLVR